MSTTAENGWRARAAGLPRGVSPDLKIRSAETALLIIDMQYGSAHPDYELGRYYAVAMPEVGRRYYERVWQVVVPNQQRLLAFFRERNLRVVYLAVGSLMEDGSDLMPLLRSRDAMIEQATGQRQSTWYGSPARQIMKEVGPLAGELVVLKQSKGAFNSSSLDQTLRNMGITGLVIGGVATNACVDSTARDAADRGYQCVLVEDACASNSQELHEATMINFQHLFGQVRTTDELLSCLQTWDSGNSATLTTPRH
jgi:nicotinamidase-related amidase